MLTDPLLREADLKEREGGEERRSTEPAAETERGRGRRADGRPFPNGSMPALAPKFPKVCFDLQRELFPLSVSNPTLIFIQSNIYHPHPLSAESVRFGVRNGITVSAPTRHSTSHYPLDQTRPALHMPGLSAHLLACLDCPASCHLPTANRASNSCCPCLERPSLSDLELCGVRPPSISVISR